MTQPGSSKPHNLQEHHWGRRPARTQAPVTMGGTVDAKGPKRDSMETGSPRARPYKLESDWKNRKETKGDEKGAKVGKIRARRYSHNIIIGYRMYHDTLMHRAHAQIFKVEEVWVVGRVYEGGEEGVWLTKLVYPLTRKRGRATREIIITA